MGSFSPQIVGLLPSPDTTIHSRLAVASVLGLCPPGVRGGTCLGLRGSWRPAEVLELSPRGFVETQTAGWRPSGGLRICISNKCPGSIAAGPRPSGRLLGSPHCQGRGGKGAERQKGQSRQGTGSAAAWTSPGGGALALEWPFPGGQRGP